MDKNFVISALREELASREKQMSKNVSEGSPLLAAVDLQRMIQIEKNILEIECEDSFA